MKRENHFHHVVGFNTTYRSSASYICWGGYYELGCGIADGSLVMTLTKLSIHLDNEPEARTCGRVDLCPLQMGAGRN